MKSRPIPIEELKSGEFYDIQISDRNPRFLGALLLEQLPNNRAKLLLLKTQAILEMESLQIEVIQLGRVYPYLTFTQLFNGALQWPNQYEGEELICQIKEEMCRAVSEGCWTFHLPHFCEGYLQVYLSYLCWNENCLNRGELIDLWFEFMGSFFSVLRDHILRVKLLSTENISGLLKAVKGMDQMSEVTLKIRKGTETYSCIEQSLKLAEKKKSFFDSYRPIELSAAKFDELWKLIMQSYHGYLIIWHLQEPLSLRCLFLNPENLIGIISRYRDLVRDLMYVDVPGLDSEKLIKVKFRIAVAAQLLHLPNDLIEHSGISAEVSSRIILEEALTEPILTINRETLQDLGFTRGEMVPSVLAYFNSVLRGTIHLPSLLKYVTARIAVEDWQFITFLIAHKSLEPVEIRQIVDATKASTQIQELITVSLEHQMSAKLLRDLLPYAIYGHSIIQTLAKRFSLPHFRELLIRYLRDEQWFICPYRSNWLCSYNKPTNMERFLIAAVTLKIWELFDLVIQNFALSPANWYDYTFENDVKGLISVALEHEMSAELLEGLLPCVTYGHLAFPVFAERFELPHCRQVMLTYFKPEQWYFDMYDSEAKKKFRFELRSLITRIALEDWEFINFLIENYTISPSNKRSFLNNKDKKEISESAEKLVSVALEHKMSVKLLEGLLPCVTYGYFVFPALAERFELPYCREVMITYFRTDLWRYNFSYPKLKERLATFLKCLSARIALKEWEFVAFVTDYSLFPAINNRHIHTKFIYPHLESILSSAVEYKMSEKLLKKLLPYADYGEFIFPAFLKALPGSLCRQMMISYFGSESRCIDIAQKLLQTQKPEKSKERALGIHVISKYLKDQKLHLWYVFGASVQMPFLWVREVARSSINRLSPGLTREICGYLV